MNNPSKVQVTLTESQVVRLKRLADLHGLCLSQMIAFIVHQWVFDNYKDHLEKFS